MAKIKICTRAKKKKDAIEEADIEFKELKSYMYLDICPQCGMSPTYQKDGERFVYCKHCGLTLDTKEFVIVTNKK